MLRTVGSRAEVGSSRMRISTRVGERLGERASASCPSNECGPCGRGRAPAHFDQGHGPVETPPVAKAAHVSQHLQPGQVAKEADFSGQEGDETSATPALAATGRSQPPWRGRRSG